MKFSFTNGQSLRGESLRVFREALATASEVTISATVDEEHEVDAIDFEPSFPEAPAHLGPEVSARSPARIVAHN